MTPGGAGRKAPPPGKIESLAGAAVVGWCVGASAAPVEVQVRAGGTPVSVRVRRVERPDVRAAHPSRRRPPDGFVAEIEAGVWTHVRDDGVVPLGVFLDGCEFELPRPFTRTLLDDWWRQLGAEAPTDERERQMLRLLSHAVAAGGPARLGADVAPGVARELADRGLDAALHEPDGAARLARAARQQARIERFDELVVVGWAGDPAGEVQDFRVLANGAEVECRVERVNRADVQQALGLAMPGLGFRIELPAGIWSRADAEGRCAIEVFVAGRRVALEPLRLDVDDLRRILADGGRPVASSGPELRLLLRVEQHAEVLAGRGFFTDADRSIVAAWLAALDPAGRRHDPEVVAVPPANAVNVALESSGGLVLAGWVLDGDEDGELFRLTCNGHEVACHVLRTHRDDVRRALGATGASEFLGFEIEVPATIWQYADADEACSLSLAVNGHPLAIGSLRIDRAVLEREVIARFGPAAANSMRGADPAAVRNRLLGWLLAEHVAASGGARRLSAEAQSALRTASAWMAMARRHGVDGRVDSASAIEERQLQRRVWRLQRRLNTMRERLSAADALDAILGDIDATGAVRAQLLLSLVPLMCDDPTALARIEAELPLDVQAWHAARGDNWQRSLYLVGLVRQGAFADACAVLERIVAAPGSGWLNTGCVAFAVRAALRPAQDDDAASRERLVGLFIDLLDSLPGGYWSRRHDLRLVETMADVAAACAGLPEPLASRGIDAALQHYGLVPSFWARVDALGVPADAALARAREDFALMRETFDALGEARELPPRWRELAERLRVQHLGRRRVALQCLRELMLADLARSRAAGVAEDLSWRFFCEGASPADGRRIESFPLPRAGEARAGGGSLWPTPDAPATPGDGPENRLELRSAPERVAALAQAPVLVVCVVRNERTMLAHFLAHYRRLGVRHFVFIDNGSDDGTPQALLAEPDVVLYAADTDYRDSHYGVAWQQAVLAAHGLGRWVVVADADELLLYRDWETVPLPDLVRKLAEAGHDAAPVLMLDMYPRGALRDTDFARTGPDAANWFDREPLLRWRLGTGLYSNAPTWLSALRHRLIPHSPPNAFTAQKIALLRYRPWVRLSEGLHYATGLTPAAEPLFFGHYKYHAGFRAKVLLEIERKQHYDGASEYAQYLAMVAEPDASLFDPELSVRLDGSPTLPAIDAEPGAGGAA